MMVLGCRLLGRAAHTFCVLLSLLSLLAPILSGGSERSAFLQTEVLRGSTVLEMGRVWPLSSQARHGGRRAHSDSPFNVELALPRGL